jgi:hypothetical protein
MTFFFFSFEPLRAVVELEVINKIVVTLSQGSCSDATTILGDDTSRLRLPR